MTKTIKFFIGAIALFSIVATTGCIKDVQDDTTTEVTNNYVMYDGTKYDLSDGILENYGKDSGDVAYNNDLTLFGGYTIYESFGTIDSLEGTGNYIYFELFSTQGEKLDLGDYLYDANETGAIKTFDFADLGVNFNIDTDTTEKEIVSGKLSVISNGTEYELSFSGMDHKNKSVSVSYKGSLRYYDSSANSVAKKKSTK